MRSETEVIYSREISGYRLVIRANILKESASSILRVAKLAELQIYGSRQWTVVLSRQMEDGELEVTFIDGKYKKEVEETE
jgi:hypothetical protein